MGFWHVYCGIYGGGGEVAAADVITRRLTLYGTSLVRPALMGTSQEQMTIMGSTPQ